MMSDLFRLSETFRRDPSVDAWLKDRSDPLGLLARRWFECMRLCGDEVREAMHDGCPTACIGDAAFGYVNIFKRHVNVGFFRGSELSDPDRLLLGTGRFMRHVKLGTERKVDEEALRQLIGRAYFQMRTKLERAGS